MKSATAPTTTSRLDRIPIRTKDRVVFLQAQQIDWIEAYGNYVQLHAENSTFLFRSTIADIEERLDPDKFIRIHRSTVVNAGRIREIHANGVHARVVLQDGTTLPLSRRRRVEVSRRLTAI